jgi:large subunit ribosomal protein L30
MASGRNRYIKGGSNKQEISQETRELIRNAKDPDDYSWQLGHGIGDPVEMDLTTEERTRATQYSVDVLGYARKIDNGVEKIKYWPNETQEIEKEEPSPVLMVSKVITLSGESKHYKYYCEQIGLGVEEEMKKKVFLPNLPSVGILLYKIKHLIQITPITFPQGMPEDFDPDVHGYRLNSNGEFIVTPTRGESVENITKRADWMKITNEDIDKEARRHWGDPYNSPLGNSNYHSNNCKIDRKNADSDFEKNKPVRRKWS